MLLIVLALYVVFVLASHHAEYDKALSHWEKSSFEIKSEAFSGSGARICLPTYGSIEARPTLLEFEDRKITLPWVSIHVKLDWFVYLIPGVYFILTVVYWFWVGSADRSIRQLRACAPRGKLVHAHTVPWVRNMFLRYGWTRTIWAIVIDLMPAVFIVAVATVFAAWQGSVGSARMLWAGIFSFLALSAQQMALGVQLRPWASDKSTSTLPLWRFASLPLFLVILFRLPSLCGIDSVHAEFQFLELLMTTFLVAATIDVFVFGVERPLATYVFVGGAFVSITVILGFLVLLLSSGARKAFVKYVKREYASLPKSKIGGTLGYYIHSENFRGDD